MDISNDLSYWTVAVVLYNTKRKEEQLDNKLLQWNSGKEWTVYLVQLEKNKFALILNTTEKNTSMDIIKSSQESIFAGNARDNVVIGVGRTYEFIGDLSKSYMDAAIAIEYVNYSTKRDKDITFFEDIERENRIHYYYPMEKEEILINYLRTGNVNKAKDALNELLEENLSRLKISQFSLKCLFYNLISTALKVLQSDDLLNIEIITDSNLMLLSANDMKVYIEEVYAKICLEVQNRKTNKNTGNIQSILKYIEANYTDADISLTSVATHFNITVPYLSRYFKEQTGSNFVEYINKKRIDKAKHLMSECSLTLEKICNIIGYDNILTFRRAFKKFEGVVPSEYREFNNTDVDMLK
jgi:YesN/AraC family two-component response regulator